MAHKPAAGARDHLERSVAISRKVNGPEHQATGDALAALGPAFTALREHAQARSCLEEAKLIYLAPNGKEAQKRFGKWHKRWQVRAPKAVDCLADDLEELFSGLPNLDEIERRYILHVLDATGNNRKRTAEILGINRKTLYRMAARFQIEFVHARYGDAAPDLR